MQTIINKYLSFSELKDFLEHLPWQGFVYMFVILVLLIIAKIINDGVNFSYRVSKELLKVDNKALALSFGGYLIGVFIIILSLSSQMSNDWHLNFNSILKNIFSLTSWTLLGIILLNISKIINDKILFSRFSNTKEIIRDQNMGMGIIQASTYISSAIIIEAILFGETSATWWIEVSDIVIFFVFVHLILWAFTYIYQLITPYDIHDKLEKDNIAVGVSLSGYFISLAMIVNHYLYQTYNLLVLLCWVINGIVLMLVFRILIDKAFFIGSNLNKEIAEDNNWGVACIEAALMIALAFTINNAFS